MFKGIRSLVPQLRARGYRIHRDTRPLILHDKLEFDPGAADATLAADPTIKGIVISQIKGNTRVYLGLNKYVDYNPHSEIYTHVTPGCKSKYHNINDPAIITPEYEEWWRNGKMHNHDGPARIDSTGNYWAYNGVKFYGKDRITSTEWLITKHKLPDLPDSAHDLLLKWESDIYSGCVHRATFADIVEGKICQEKEIEYERGEIVKTTYARNGLLHNDSGYAVITPKSKYWALCGVVFDPAGCIIEECHKTDIIRYYKRKLPDNGIQTLSHWIAESDTGKILYATFVDMQDNKIVRVVECYVEYGDQAKFVGDGFDDPTSGEFRTYNADGVVTITHKLNGIPHHAHGPAIITKEKKIWALRGVLFDPDGFDIEKSADGNVYTRKSLPDNGVGVLNKWTVSGCWYLVMQSAEFVDIVNGKITSRRLEKYSRGELVECETDALDYRDGTEI